MTTYPTLPAVLFFLLLQSSNSTAFGAAQIKLSSWLAKNYEKLIQSPALKEKLKRLDKSNKKYTIVLTPTTVAQVQAHYKPIQAIAYNSKKNLILTASKDGRIKIWNATTLTNIKTLRVALYPITSITMSIDGTHIAFSTSQNIGEIWNIEGKKVCTMCGHVGHLAPHAFSRDNTQLLGPSNKGCINIWDTQTGSIKKQIKGHTSFVTHAELDSSEKKCVTASDDGTAKIWNLKTRSLVQKFQPSAELDWVQTATFCPQTNTIITGQFDTVIQKWHPYAPTRPELSFIAHPDAQIRSIRISDNGQELLTVSSMGEIKIWQTKNGKCQNTISLPDGIQTTCAIFGEKNTHIYCGDQAGKLSVTQLKAILSLKEKIIYDAFKKSGLQSVSLPPRSLFSRLWNTPQPYGVQLINNINYVCPAEKPLIPMNNSLKSLL
ncbi:MAG: Peptidase C14, caspase catalytic subunit p20 [candidate division TM6 bacterium GW2011_GWF2_43_17]|nr:MAG: Peptidase C14, caspase catalytic subunit p20 [candidate division TM6 bacterium GW2011_GWF2_43_17]